MQGQDRHYWPHVSAPSKTLRELTMFGLPTVLFQKLLELPLRKRRTDEKSPDRVAPGLVEHLSLIFCFDALRDHVKTERLAQRDNRSYQQPRPPTRINVQIVHERAVDLERIHGGPH